MKSNLVLLLTSTFFLFIFSCNDSFKKKPENKIVYSKNQQYLFNLLDSYKSEYFATQRQDLRDAVREKYFEKLRYFLIDSLGRQLDSMNVTVDTVIQKGWLVTTQFHSRDIEFKYDLEFKDSMDSKANSIYEWMRNLKPKSNYTLNFILLGSGELNDLEDTSKSMLKMMALPEPLAAQQ